MDLIPIVTLESPTVNKISDEIEHTQCKCKFSVDMDIYQWESRAVKGDYEPKLGEGTLVESGGELQKGSFAEIVIDDIELTEGDGKYTISVYVQGKNGYWSDGTYMAIYKGIKYNTSENYNSFRRYNFKS